MAHWRQAGIDTVVSLLTADEEASLHLKDEAAQAIAHGMFFISFPLLDRQVPASETEFTRKAQQLETELANGRNVVVHCRQGIGRTGLVAAGLLLAKAFDPEAALNLLSSARGIPVPETLDQRRWLDRYANQFAVVR
jgi:protein-tyrosine phosphatase